MWAKRRFYPWEFRLKLDILIQISSDPLYHRLNLIYWYNDRTFLSRFSGWTSASLSGVSSRLELRARVLTNRVLTNPLIIRHHHISLNLLALRARNSSHFIHKYISNKSYGAWRHNKIQWKNFKGWKPWIIAGGNGSNLSAGHNWGNIAELCWFELLKILLWPETVIC